MISSHRSQSTFQVAFISASPLPRQRAISFPYPQVYSPCKRWYLVSANEKPDSRVNPKKVFVSNNGKAPRRPTQLSNAPQPSYSNVLPSDRGVFPPGKLPLSLEIDFLLSHPWTDVSITFLVVLNCFAFALQTIDVGPVLHEVFRSYENNVTIAFLIEYFCRWYGKGLSPRFLLTRRMIIDFLAVSPIAFAVTDQSEVLFVRMLRLTRIFRLERMVMDTKSSQDKMKGMTFVQVQLASIGLSLFSLLYVSAGLFYQVEKGVNPAILNFFDAFYFSTITLFTVGFGDVTPLTSWGRIITVLTVLSGAILIPFKLSTLEKVRQLGERNKLLNKIGTNGEELPPFTVRTPLFNLRIECPQCHLQGHQKDARFCRNCGKLLKQRLFD